MKALRGATGHLPVIAASARMIDATCALLATRSTWTQRAEARDRHGHPVGYADPRAVRWCLAAAVARAGDEVRETESPSGGSAELHEWGVQAALVGIAHALALELGIALRWTTAATHTPTADAGGSPIEVVWPRQTANALVLLNDAKQTRYRHVAAALKRASFGVSVLDDQEQLDALLTRWRAQLDAAGGAPA